MIPLAALSLALIFLIALFAWKRRQGGTATLTKNFQTKLKVGDLVDMSGLTYIVESIPNETTVRVRLMKAR